MEQRAYVRSGLLASAIVLALSNPAAAARVYGVGSQKCSKFTQMISEYKAAPDNIEWETYAYAWAQGYMSRKNVDRENRGKPPIPNLAPPDFNAPQQKSFLRSYCAANPNELYVRGVDKVYDRLLSMFALTS